MPNPLLISDAVDATNVAIQDFWVKGSEKESRLFESYFNVESGVVDLYLKDSSISGLGYAGRIVENAAATAASPVQGYNQTYTQVQYGVLLTFTKLMWYFGIKKRKIEEIVEEARMACSDMREQRCADRLDQSYATAYTVNDISGNYPATVTGGDGLAFVSASHTREDGGASWSNRVTDGSTVNLSFDYPGLKAAKRTAALQVGPTGKPLNVNLDTLIVSRGYAPQNRADEILGAIARGMIPGSADRDGAAVASYKIIPNPWIQTNTLYWWMFDSTKKGPKYGFQFKESQPIQLEGPHIVFKTGEIQYKATTMFDLGFNDPRGWVGSKGTNAT